MGLIAQGTHVIRRLGALPAKAAGPALMAAGGLALLYPAWVAVRGAMSQGGRVDATATYSAFKQDAVPGAILLGTGIVVTKAIGKAAR